MEINKEEEIGEVKEGGRERERGRERVKRGHPPTVMSLIHPLSRTVIQGGMPPNGPGGEPIPQCILSAPSPQQQQEQPQEQEEQLQC